MKTKKAVKRTLVVALAIGTLLGGFVATKTIDAASNHTVEVSSKQNHTQLLKQTMSLAKQGKVKTSGEFGLRSTEKSILSKWGKPDKNSNKAEGELKYSNHSTRFYVGNDVTDTGGVSTVYSLHTTDKSYASVTYDEVKKWGKPSVYTDKTSGFLSYQAGDNSLTFYFTRDKNGKYSNVKYVEVNMP